MPKAAIIVLAVLLSGCAPQIKNASLPPDELADLPSTELCESYFWARTKKKHLQTKLRAELDRRTEISEAEWRLIEQSEIAPGMSELALSCSWGRPGPFCGGIDESITANGIHRRWIYDACSYGKTRFVYTDNGVVIAHKVGHYHDTNN